jgi:putative ABC transport system substrate-binding protein
MPVIGYLGVQSAADHKDVTVPFLQGLKETGWVVGQNAAFEYRWAENQFDRLPALAADLVRRRVAVIVAGSTAAALAAKSATTNIPIVFGTGGEGLVASLNRPGANVTGIAGLIGELSPKRLQLLRELIPNASVFGVLADPTAPPTQSAVADLRAAARNIGLQLIVVDARTDSDLETAFATSVLFGNGNFFNQRTEQLPALAARYKLPAIFPLREYASAGGLMSYGSSLGYGARQVGIYTGPLVSQR